MSRIETFFRTPILTDRTKPHFEIDEVREVIFWAPSDLSSFSKFGVLPDRSPFNYFYEECEWNPIIKKKITEFMERVEHTGIYTSGERDLIGRALIMATVAHQYNYDTESRYRKKTFPDTDEAVPYIFHPIEIAKRLVMDGFDWITVAASLLHDVPEDADLGDGMNTKEDWLRLIRNEFNFAGRINNIKVGINQDTEAGDLLVDLIDGVTEKKFDFSAGEKDREEYLRIRETPLYKIIFSFVERGGQSNPKANAREVSYEEKYAIASVTHNLEFLFNTALKSPDHWRIFILKIADIWHNFQSIEMIKSTKILRGKIAANLAEWMGWYEMRSEIIRMLAEETDTTSPYSPDLGGKVSPSSSDSNVDKDLERIEKDAETIIGKLTQRTGWSSLKRAEIRAGWPVDCREDFRMLYHSKPNWKSAEAVDITSLPVPEVIVKIEDLKNLDTRLEENDLFRLRKSLGVVEVPRKKLVQGYSPARFSRHDTNISQFLRNAFGRVRYDYTATIGNESSFGFRLEDSSQPYIIDLFRGNSSVTPEAIPEAGLFNNRLQGVDPELWRYHLVRLIPLFYDLNTPFSRGEIPSDVYALSWRGDFLIVDGSRNNLKKIAQIMGEEVGDEIEVMRLNGRMEKFSSTKPISTHLSYYGDSIRDRLEIFPVRK